jgi:hypothetical protein
MTMSSPVGRLALVETGISCSYGRFYCKQNRGCITQMQQTTHDVSNCNSYIQD